MFFLNLSAGEFFALLGALGGLVTALYLLDRTKRKKIVSTLHFWTFAAAAQDQQPRKRMNQPWSLLLQLLSLALLLLAIAQLQWGTRGARALDHVLLIDTSAWSGQRVSAEAGAPAGILLDRERQAAGRYLGSLGASDRVLLVKVDALTTPATSFTSDTAHLLKELNDSKPGSSALNLAQALTFAQQAQSWSGGEPGEITYVGPGRTAGEKLGPLPRNLRAIFTPANGENCRIRSVAVTRSDTDANSWQATVTLKNEGQLSRPVHLKTQFAGTVFTPRSYLLKAGEELPAEYTFVTNTAGRFVAQLDPPDALPGDDIASLELPPPTAFDIVAYTRRRELLDPLLRSDHRLRVEYLDPARYQAERTASLVILDGFAPAQSPKGASLWINPPKLNSPLPVKVVLSNAAITAWHADSDLAAGLHAREDRLPLAEVFETQNGDVALASLHEGPTVVLRPARSPGSKLAVVGFDPLGEHLRFSVTAPLLFANLLHWLAPESSRIMEVTANRVGAASINLEPGERTDRIKVSDSRGFAVPFTSQEGKLQLFTDKPEVLRIASPERERVVNLTLPDVVTQQWKPTGIQEGAPPVRSFTPTARDLWKWLACLGGLGLIAEWYLFGGGRGMALVRRLAISRQASYSASAKERPKEEMVAR